MGGGTNRMWGGRFAAGPEAVMEAINASIGFDKRLAPQDVAGSKAHAEMLAAAGIISKADAAALAQGLERILAEIEAGAFDFSTALEDIHMNVEARLAELVGEPAGRLHTARSRNDQVAVDLRLWVRERLDETAAGIESLMRACLAQAQARRRSGHAGLHPHAGGAAGDLGPSHDGLCRDVRPRSRALPRRAGAHERMPPRRRGARGHVVSDRPGT